MHFNKNLLALGALFVSGVFSAPVADKSLVERDAVTDALNSVAQAAGTLNTASVTSTNAINTSLNQILGSLTATLGITVTSNVNANLQSIANAATSAATAITGALGTAGATLTQPQINNLQASIQVLENASVRILAALRAAAASQIANTATEAATIQQQTAVIVGALSKIEQSLETYVAASTTTGSNGVTGTVAEVATAVTSLLNGFSASLGIST